MGYQVLARKWRPSAFDQMVGQEHVVKALTTALESDRLHHAYLFTGTRGVGKTTVARLLAKSLNCETGTTSSPCGQCSSCMEIAEGRSVDVLEVDAASRTKVEDTRDLLDNVQYAPSHSRFKIYLIDEVHMLSNHSFNALLKTLEEPGDDTHFILLTDKPGKLLDTIRSRTLAVRFGLLPPPVLATLLEKAGVNADEEALMSGSVSRALSLSQDDEISLRAEFLELADDALESAKRASALSFAEGRASAKVDQLKQLESLAGLFAQRAREQTHPAQSANRHRRTREAIAELERNANAQLVFESLMLDLQTL